MIKLNKQELPLRFDMNALSEFEELTKVSAFELSGVTIGAKEIRALTYAGLKAANEDFTMTIEQVGKHLRPAHLNQVMEAFVRDMKSMEGEEGKGN